MQEIKSAKRRARVRAQMEERYGAMLATVDQLSSPPAHEEASVLPLR